MYKKVDISCGIDLSISIISSEVDKRLAIL